jgi:hypothetical protein
MVATMTVHVDKSKSGKYVRYLLRSSFRVDGKVKHRTVANISHCSPEEIDAIKLALQHKGDLTPLVSLREEGLPINLASGQIGLRQVALALSKRELRRWKRSPRQNNWQTHYYIVDQLFNEAELRLGESPQTIVRIVRAKPK